MKPVFADSFYFLALLSEQDAAHGMAVRFSRENARPLVTTAWVLMEVADALARPETRSSFGRLLMALETSSDVEVIPPSNDLFHRAVKLYSSRSDKAWSLTDCTSFIVMADEGITDVLTGDRHFEQAGFQLLFK